MFYSKRGNKCSPQTSALTSNKKYIMPTNLVYRKLPTCVPKEVKQLSCNNVTELPVQNVKERKCCSN